jgi:SAM-dependent methyltransferase
VKNGAQGTLVPAVFDTMRRPIRSHGVPVRGQWSMSHEMSTGGRAQRNADERHDRREMWNERYAASERVWSSGPNEHVARILEPLPPGAAVDLGAGEGRHALWLAERGWTVTAVDFAEVGLDRGRREAAERGVGNLVNWVAADVTTWTPPQGHGFDLVLVAYLHLPENVLDSAAGWVGPGGHLVVVGHALRNLTEGVGGPQDPALLHTPEQLQRAADGLGILRCEEVERTTEGGGTAIDLVLVAARPAHRP